MGKIHDRGERKPIIYVHDGSARATAVCFVLFYYLFYLPIADLDQLMPRWILFSALFYKYFADAGLRVLTRGTPFSFQFLHESTGLK